VADNLLFPYPVRALTGLGVALSRGGEPVQAVMAFQKALRLFPGNPTVLYLLGETYFDMGKHDLACDALAQALRLEENDNGIRFLYGESLVKLERYDEALEQFREIANREDDTALGRQARDLVRLLEKN
jgi:tetratricopeptide (TPR) repeat protein